MADTLLEFIRSRLQESSTWRGIVALRSAGGVSINRCTNTLEITTDN